MKKITKLERKELNKVLLDQFNKKSCSTCNRVLPLENFTENIDTRVSKGFTLHPRCKACGVDRLKSTSRANILIKKYL